MIRSWDVISDKDVLNAAFLSKTDIETQNVAGPVNFTGSISILSGLSVGGDASFSGDVQISKESPVFTIKNTSGTDVAIVLDRSSNANWRILSTAENLKIQSDYTTIKDVYYDILTLYYNTGNASLKGALTAAALSITGDATIAGSTTINGDTIISGAITANKITVLGSAASHPLRTRGIQGITEDGNATDALYLNYGTNHPVYINNETNIVWHSGNDGAGSGLDADLFDGKDSNAYAHSASVGSGSDLNTITQSGMYRLGSSMVNAPDGVNWGQLLVIHGGGDTITQIATDFSSNKIYWRSGNPPDVYGSGSWGTWRKIWHEGNDGSSSGLDADLVDGKHYSDITSYVDNAIGTYINQSVKTTASPTFAGLTINGPITIQGKFRIEYNSTTKSLDFNFIR